MFDTNIFVCRDNEKEAYENANTVLKNFNDYMTLNLLHINLDKSAYCTLGQVIIQEEDLPARELYHMEAKEQ